MKHLVSFRFLAGLFVLLAARLPAQESKTNSPADLLRAAFVRVMDIIEPTNNAAPATFTTSIRVLEAEGLPKEVVGRSARLAWQPPDHLALSVELDGDAWAMGRDGEDLWVHVASKKFGVVGRPDLPKFKTAPEKRDATRLGPFKLPLQRAQLLVLPLLMKVESLPDETIDGVRCRVLKAAAVPEVRQFLAIPMGQWQLALRESDALPVRLGYREPDKWSLVVQFEKTTEGQPIPESRWKIPAREGDKTEITALGHMVRFFPAALAQLTSKARPLPPSDGERQVLATEGSGRLELIDHTRVLFLKGTPEEMGRQQGTLMSRQIRNLVSRILYGVGVGSSFAKGRWFFGEIEEAQGRLMPFMDPRYLREMDGIARAAGLEPEEVRLANFFPELFHCSGFALAGEATVDGHLYHGRILDYLRGMGLEQNAVVVVAQPDQGNAWVNISYAGFVGSVTAMNEKKVAIGEMGGRGEGRWDGKPMAQLMREVMEKAGTLEEAIEIMRKGPRTCEYYYVISDGKTRQSVGIAATPDKFELIRPGESHPRLPHPFKDVVLMSAGDRYEALAERVKAGYGKFDAEAARGLMKRPVCMKSNIHSVLFEPDTLDFWVANADSENVASHTRFTRYNLAELLKEPAPTAAK
jgi:isopenicillin-N N-acyltransferase like protein